MGQVVVVAISGWLGLARVERIANRAGNRVEYRMLKTIWCEDSEVQKRVGEK